METAALRSSAGHTDLCSVDDRHTRLLRSLMDLGNTAETVMVGDTQSRIAKLPRQFHHLGRM
jgi:hypothetical protein